MPRRRPSTTAGDTWYHGIYLGERAEAWTTLWTGGKGTYCTTQQEDNATYMALTRGAISGLVDLNRVRHKHHEMH
jgi:purine nucleoside permease